MRIARRILTLRMLEGMSRADLAQAAQISEDRASEIEQGRRRPRGKELFQLAAALHVDFEQLTADVSLEDVQEPDGIPPKREAQARADSLEESLYKLHRDHEFQDLVRQLAARVAQQ